MNVSPINSTLKKANLKNARPTIGMFLDHIGPYGINVWHGVTQVAQEQDINLISFMGGVFPALAKFTPHGKVIYDLANTDTVDGLILLSALLSSAFPPSEFETFYQRYHPLPMASIGLALPNIPSVLVDNRKGLQDLLIHLIEGHGYKQIAFIKGPDGNPEANLRYTVYTEMLANYGLALNPQLVAPGNFFPLDGAEAVDLLLEKRQVSPEVIVAANDDMALGAIEALQQKGIRVPYDIAVVGFDDMENSRYINPPLTTVRQPLYQQGYWAMAVILAQLRGESVGMVETLSTELVVRQSCGCISHAVQYAKAIEVVTEFNTAPTGAGVKATLDTERSHILAKMEQTMGNALPDNHRLLPAAWAEQLLDAFSFELQTNTPNIFLPVLNVLSHQVLKAGVDVTIWQEILSTLRRYLLPYFSKRRTLIQAEDLWHQARVMLGEIAQLIQTDPVAQSTRRDIILRQISQQLISTFNVTGLINVLAEELPRLNINHGYLALYTHEADSKRRTVTKWATLILAYNHNKRLPLGNGHQFLTHSLIPTQFLPTPDRYSLVIEPLHFREEQLGFILLDMNMQTKDIYDSLNREISSALKGALLVQEIQNHALNLEEEVAARTQDLARQTHQLAKAKEVAEAANQAKSKFLANMSHELRTPLNAVLGFAQVMQRDSNLSPEQAENLHIITRSGEHLLGLINDVLEMSKIEANRSILKETQFNLHNLLDDLYNMFYLQAQDKGVALIFDLAPTLPEYILADAAKLRQVLINLLGNALKFTYVGRVVLRASYKKEREIEEQRGAETERQSVNNEVHKAWFRPSLRFEVEDTGIGIAADELDSLFDPFTQTESGQALQSGTGLGLTISQEFVKLMGGEIKVSSVFKQGSTFSFKIGVKLLESNEMKPQKINKQVIGLTPNQPPYRILIVDDKLENRKLLQKLLKPIGFEVREAENGQQGIAIWEAWSPHLIWMDIRMPVMDGYEATKYIKSTVKGLNTKIIAITTSVFEDKRTAILAIGCDDFLHKPFQEAHFFEMMAKHLGVRYKYAPQKDKPLTKTQKTMLEHPPVDRWDGIPSELIQALERAATEADFEELLLIIDKIQKLDKFLGGYLLGFVNKFAYDKIVALIAQKEENK